MSPPAGESSSRFPLTFQLQEGRRQASAGQPRTEEAPMTSQRPGEQGQPRPVRPRQPRRNARPLAQGDSELMAQHQDLGVLPPRLPSAQAQHRQDTGDNEEDQLQAHKPKIIARPPACKPATNRQARALTLWPPRRIRLGGIAFSAPTGLGESGTAGSSRRPCRTDPGGDWSGALTSQIRPATARRRCERRDRATASMSARPLNKSLIHGLPGNCSCSPCTPIASR
jgi:hypothetical protein